MPGPRRRNRGLWICMGVSVLVGVVLLAFVIVFVWWPQPRG